jgi:hypothetical protein
VKGRRLDSSLEWASRAHAALALECLKRCGENLDVAAGRLARGKQFDGKTLKNWRHELNAGRVGNFLAQQVWSNGMARIKELNQHELRQAAQAFIGHAVAEAQLRPVVY